MNMKARPVILVIDDSKELLEVVQLICEKQGYDAITNTSSIDIAAFVTEHKIDLLIIDVILNGENGRDICKELKSNAGTNYFPIILMSASSEHLSDHGDCDADDIIEKPFDIKTLFGKVGKWVVGS